MTHSFRYYLSLAALTVAVSAPTLSTLPAKAQLPATAQPSPPARSMVALGSSSEMALKELREALMKVPGVAKVEIDRKSSGAAMRIFGDARPQLLSAAALAVGFDLMPPSPRSFAARGSSADEDLKRLRDAVSKVAPGAQMQLAGSPEGATLHIRTDAKAAALIAAAKEAGFEMKQVGNYVASGSAPDADPKRLQAALGKVPGVEKVEVQSVAGGATLLVQGEAEEDALVAGAKSVGFALRYLNPASETSEERITPPAPGERKIDNLTKLGELAPDFTLLTKDGKSKISLSQYRDKQPVVLIFGSYT